MRDNWNIQMRWEVGEELGRIDGGKTAIKISIFNKRGERKEERYKVWKQVDLGS